MLNPFPLCLCLIVLNLRFNQRAMYSACIHIASLTDFTLSTAWMPGVRVIWFESHVLVVKQTNEESCSLQLHKSRHVKDLPFSP